MLLFSFDIPNYSGVHRKTETKDQRKIGFHQLFHWH